MKKNNKIVSSLGGIRLDAYLSQELREISKQDIKKLCLTGKILINGKSARPGIILKINDILEITALDKCVEQKDLPALEIIYEDEFLIVSVKPRAIHSVSQKFKNAPSYADALAAYCPDCKNAGKDPLESGLVQRLDYYTSGLIIAAKDKSTWASLHKDFLTHKIQKEYLALIEGLPQSEIGVIDTYLKMKPNRVSVESEEKENTVRAITNYQVIKKVTLVNNSYSVICASTNSGKRHQIRVHLAHLGHPLIGDELYGSKMSLNQIPSMKLIGKGFLLHASKLKFNHPQTRKELSLENITAEFAKIGR